MPWFVSNDELRDHVFGMKGSRELEMWRERKGVKFNFGEWDEGGDGGGGWRTPVLKYPRRWSWRPFLRWRRPFLRTRWRRLHGHGSARASEEGMGAPR